MEISYKYLFNAFANEVLCEVGQLPQVAILAPHTLKRSNDLLQQKLSISFSNTNLGDHLRKLHGGNGRAKPAIWAEDVHTGLDQADRLAQDGLEKGGFSVWCYF